VASGRILFLFIIIIIYVMCEVHRFIYIMIVVLIQIICDTLLSEWQKQRARL
jgi:hypothetical protein